jgi:hypothetical protein
MVKSQQYFLTLVHAETARCGRPVVRSGVTLLTAQHYGNALPGQTYFSRNGRGRQATMTKSKDQPPLLVGQVGRHLDLLDEWS